MERRHPRYWLVESKEKSSHKHLYVLASILLSSLFVLFWKVYADGQIAYEVRSKQEDKAYESSLDFNSRPVQRQG
jgi:hypothetical protein